MRDPRLLFKEQEREKDSAEILLFIAPPAVISFFFFFVLSEARKEANFLSSLLVSLRRLLSWCGSSKPESLYIYIYGIY